MLFTKAHLKDHLRNLNLEHDDTVLIHSSMKAIGEVEGGAETVISAFIEYFYDGLLIFPTHTWKYIDEPDFVFNPQASPSCVGLLTNLFMKRQDVVRSLHPTHSVAAIGKTAKEYVQGEEQCNTPCPRKGCWGKLYDLNAKILFVGCSLKRNTIIHGVEEWNNIPNRLSPEPRAFKIDLNNGGTYTHLSHTHKSPVKDISFNYDKLEPALFKHRIAKLDYFGNAKTYVCDVVNMVDITSKFLKKEPNLFLDDKPIPEEWYRLQSS